MNTIDNMLEKARLAQKEFENFTQEQVDKVVIAIGKAIYDAAEQLSEEAVAETGFGRVDSKIFKHRKSCLANWAYMKDKKSVGIIDDDKINCVVTYAKPVGVVACITPSTNPTSTPASNAMSILKCRNAVIVAPHPKAKNCTIHAVQIMCDAIKKAGAPDNLIQVIEEPTLPLSQELMTKVDVVVATGGGGVVKAAYASGKPSFGVGQGNVQVLIAPDYTDYEFATAKIANNRCYDNGIPCTCEQSIFYPAQNEDKLIKALEKEGGYFIQGEKRQALKDLLFTEDGKLNVKCVGMPAVKIAKSIGVDVPEDTKTLFVKGEGYAKDDLFAKEKLCPVLTLYGYNTFEEAVQNAKKNLLMEGAGHTSGVYTNDDEVAKYVGEELPVGRVVVNQPCSAASGASFTNGLAPTISLGCGSWGNNSISENLTFKHLMNFTKVAYSVPNMEMPSPEEIFGE